MGSLACRWEGELRRPTVSIDQWVTHKIDPHTRRILGIPFFLEGKDRK
jgi:hypothetical protein